MHSSASNGATSRSIDAGASSSTAFNSLEYRRSRSNTPNNDPCFIDLSYMDLEDCEPQLRSAVDSSLHATFLLLESNLLKDLPPIISFFQHVETLDLSYNRLKTLSVDVCKMPRLRNLILRDNLLTDSSLPKEFAELGELEVVNLSGNLFTQFPYQLLEIKSLREIYLGSNKISVLPRNYENLQRLEILYLGGNLLNTVPEELCQLRNLSSLNLSNNSLKSLPNHLAKLKKIKNLALHDNNLTTLPLELLKLNLHELSLRNNPLVSRFAKTYSYNVPSLLELCGRTVKSRGIPYEKSQLPAHLVDYLNSAKCCLNPKCKGVYFTSKVEHVKFVDFCGKYRVPLMQYLCSSTCNEKISSGVVFSSESESSDEETENKLLKKILIG